MIDASAPPMRMRFSYESRCRAVQLLESGTSVAEAARMCGASRATGYRWWARYRAEGWRGLHERPPIPHHQPRRLSPEAEAEILAVRLRSNEGPQRVGAIVGRAASTVGKVLRRLGYSRPPKAPQPTVLRYERERPGELLHIDIKKLGRFWHVGKRIRQDGVQRSPRAGWHHVHVAVDDHTRIAYSEVLPSEGASDAVAFLERAYRWYAQQGITVESVMTDNGSAYRSALWREACVAHALRHLRTRPPTPRAPTARLNASSRPCSGSGPTATPTPPACTAPAPFQAGFAGITSAVPTAPSLASHRLAVSHTSVVSTPSSPRPSWWAE